MNRIAQHAQRYLNEAIVRADPNNAMHMVTMHTQSILLTIVKLKDALKKARMRSELKEIQAHEKWFNDINKRSVKINVRVNKDEQIDESYEKCLDYVKELGLNTKKHDFRKVFDDVVDKVGNDEEKVMRAFKTAVGKYSIDL